MEIVEDIVIVGAGVAGLTTSLGLHRLGIRSLVLESSKSLRTTGFILTIWNNGWKVLDTFGIGDSLRQQHCRGGHETRSVMRRKDLVEALAKELPSETIRFSSKVVSIMESGYFKLLHLADNTVIKTKVLIGCDGVNSVVAKWLGFKSPAFTKRSAIRAFTEFGDNNGFESKEFWFIRNGFRSGFLPCDDKTIYWFLNWIPSIQEKLEMEENPATMKQIVLRRLGEIPDKVKATIEKTKMDNIAFTTIRYRQPWDLIWGNISKGNVCVAGDAFHPMTPYIGQGGCAALEDGVVLARCLAEALLSKNAEDEREKYMRIELGLNKYSSERRWRGVKFVTIAYVVGYIQNSPGVLISFLRDKFLAKLLTKMLWKLADYDCGKLNKA